MKIYFETAKGSLEQSKSNRCNDYLDNECNSFANTCTMVNCLQLTCHYLEKSVSKGAQLVSYLYVSTHN